MTREEAIRWLNDRKVKYLELIRRYPSVSQLMLTTQVIDMAIESLQADAEWIPCSDRLPIESGDYLCTIPLGEVDTYMDLLTFHKGRFYEDDDEWGATYHDDVLAWMPLPKPYKGGDTE